MDARARRVQAERNRRRLPRTPPSARWARRIAGLVATAALLATGVAIAAMVIPDDGRQAPAAAVAPTPTATNTPKPKKKKAKARKPKGPTKAQRAQRAAAVQAVRDQGYTTIRERDYDFDATLRVLIGRPVGDAAGGYRAFFFNRKTYLGTDSIAPSTRLRVAKQGKVTVMLSYGTYAQGDPPGDPSGRKRVRFRLEGGTLTPLDTIPPDFVRFIRRN
jgi:hypothetical protein